MDSASQAAGKDRLSLSTILSMCGVYFMILMATLDISALNVSLPTLMKSLGTSFSSVQWVVISYMLAIACTLLQFARLGDMLNKKKLFFWGVVTFTVASALCGAAPTVPLLIAGRAVQGVGAAMCQSLAAAILAEIAGPNHRGKALGLFTAIFAVGLMLGPSLGSFCLQWVGWRAIFFINIPIGALTLLVIWRLMPALPPPRSGQTFDIPGALLTAVTLGSFCLGMTMAQRRGFSAPLTLALFAITVLGFAAFIAVERRVKMPMVSLHLFRNPVFGLNLFVNLLNFISSAGQTFLPFYLQLGRGYAYAEVGLFMIATPAAIAVVSPFSGFMADRYGTRVISFVGLLLLCFSVMLLSTLSMTTPWWGIALRSFLLGAGVGIFQAPNNSSVIAAAPKEHLGIASGLLTYTRVIGQNTGIPLMGALIAFGAAAFTHLTDPNDFSSAPPIAVVAGVTFAYMVLAGILCFAVLLALIAWHLEKKQERARAMPT